MYDATDKYAWSRLDMATCSFDSHNFSYILYTLTGMLLLSASAMIVSNNSDRSFLVDKYSLDTFIGFCQSGVNFDEAFGEDYETLKAEWMDYLEELVLGDQGCQSSDEGYQRPGD